MALVRLFSRSFPMSYRAARFIAFSKKHITLSNKFCADIAPVKRDFSIKSESSEKFSKFLEREIKLEAESRIHSNDMPVVHGFLTSFDGPVVKLRKNYLDEVIEVTFSVSGSVGALDEEDEEVELQDKENAVLTSKPDFTIDVKKTDKVLSFFCSFLPNDMSNTGENVAVEDFQINEFTVHSGDENEKVYSADCSVIDGDLYDRLLGYLEERGMGEQFASEMIKLSTCYEHKNYIDLLKNLKEFVH